MSTEVEALLARLDAGYLTATDTANAAALIRAQAEEIARLCDELATVAQAERERCVFLIETLDLTMEAHKYPSPEERHLAMIVEAGCRGAFIEVIRAIAPHATGDASSAREFAHGMRVARGGKEPASGWARQVSLESIKGYLGPARRGILSDREWLNIIERLHQLWISKESEAAPSAGDSDHPDFAPGLALTPGGVCAKCGFTYWAHRGHIIACPVCENDRLRAVADAAKAELENIAIAQRFDKDQFEDDSSFADWARSRARHTLDAVRALEGKS